jgi:hypothetical protein
LKKKEKMKKTIKFADNIDDAETANEEKAMASRWITHRSSIAPASFVSDQLVDLTPIHYQNISIEIRVIFLKLGNISTKEGKFSCEAFLDASWLDPHFSASKESDQNEEEVELKYDERSNWNPRLYIKNLVSHYYQEIWYNVEPANDEGSGACRVSERRRIKGEFSQEFDLRQFPIDLQELCISISTFRTSKELSLMLSKEKSSSVNQSTFTQTHEWVLDDTVCNVETIKQSEFSALRHSALDISVCVTRKPYYYVWNAFLFKFIITLICLCCFSIKCDIASNRLIVSITVFLTLITFKWAINKNLPSLSYLTTLDQYSLMCIFFVFVNCIYFSIMGAITIENCLTPYKQIDNSIFYASACAFVAINFLFVVRFLLFNKRNNKRLAKRKQEYNKISLGKRARIKSIFQSSRTESE